MKINKIIIMFFQNNDLPISDDLDKDGITTEKIRKFVSKYYSKNYNKYLDLPNEIIVFDSLTFAYKYENVCLVNKEKDLYYNGLL